MTTVNSHPSTSYGYIVHSIILSHKLLFTVAERDTRVSRLSRGILHILRLSRRILRVCHADFCAFRVCHVEFCAFLTCYFTQIAFHLAFCILHYAFRISHFEFRISHFAFCISHFASRILHFPFDVHIWHLYDPRLSCGTTVGVCSYG